jgi:hypothetical protein
LSEFINSRCNVDDPVQLVKIISAKVKLLVRNLVALTLLFVCLMIFGFEENLCRNKNIGQRIIVLLIIV